MKGRADTYLALERDMLRCLAPEASAVINGRLMSVELLLESSHLAFSAASLNLCTASLSPVRSIPCTIHLKWDVADCYCCYYHHHHSYDYWYDISYQHCCRYEYWMLGAISAILPWIFCSLTLSFCFSRLVICLKRYAVRILSYCLKHYRCQLYRKGHRLMVLTCNTLWSKSDMGPRDICLIRFEIS